MPRLVKNPHGATKPGAAKSKATWIPMFIAALFTGAKIWKQPQCPSTGERIKKIWYILNIYSGIKFIQEKDVLLFVTTWLELEGIMLSEKSLREKDKYCMILPICRI